MEILLGFAKFTYVRSKTKCEFPWFYLIIAEAIVGNLASGLKSSALLTVLVYVKMGESRMERNKTNDGKSTVEERYKCLCSIVNNESKDWNTLSLSIAAVTSSYWALKFFCPAQGVYVHVWGSDGIKQWGWPEQ